MLIIKLAVRNILGAGLRTWLNVFILSLAFLTIVGVQGLLQGFNQQAMDAMIDMELGGGQFWHRRYDRYDPLSIENAHEKMPESLTRLIRKGEATAILMTSGAIFPEGRIQSVVLKGIDPAQTLLDIPSAILQTHGEGDIPALIGSRMAKEARLEKGEVVTLRWRDIFGTFDATEIVVAGIMSTSVQSVDSNQIWIPLDTLREMIQAPGQATLVVLSKNLRNIPPDDGVFVFRDLDFLLKDLTAFIKTKSAGSSILYVLLLFMSLLAVFDTQILSIFRRRKEMGTLMALGMPRTAIIGLFTLEGALHGVLALAMAAVYGVPLLALAAVKGIALPSMTESIGLAIADTVYPAYGAGLVLGTTFLILITVTIVSFLPTRRISRLKPTDALRGKFT
jgi:putative ABC transport system permease protein